MNKIIVSNKDKSYSEILSSFSKESFKIEDEINNSRYISFTAYKTNDDGDIYEYLINDNIITWDNQDYIIEVVNNKSDGVQLTKEIEARHIMYQFQNHFINKNIEDESLNYDEGENSSSLYTLQQYLDFGFLNNKQNINYKIVSNIDKKVPIDELGDKNGIEHLVEGAELFGYIFYADNKTIYIYSEEDFYKMSEVELISGYNVDETNLSINTQEQKTYIKGYGKKRTKTETKNYNPIKPPDLKYNGTFFKEGTWRTQVVGASYEKRFECKWGNETLTWTLKKLSRGGLLDIYLDGELIGRYSCYSHTAKSEQIVIANNLSKGWHIFKAVHRGKDPNVKEYKTAPAMYVGTEKSTVLNLTAKLKGEDIYSISSEYTSPYYDKKNPKIAQTLFDDSITSKEELDLKLKETLNDEPTVELSTNYLGREKVQINNKVYFKNKNLKFDTILKVVKITKSHPDLYLPDSIEFSNKKTDIISLQKIINNKYNKLNSKITNYQNNNEFNMPKIASDSFGSVLINE